MKKVFFGLAVAAVALSASAFTNAQNANGKRLLQTIYFTAESSGVYTYNSSGAGVSCDTTNPDFCSATTAGTFSLPASGTISEADIQNPAKFNQSSLRFRNGY